MIQRYNTFLEKTNFFLSFLAILDKLVKNLDEFLYVFRQINKFFTLK